MSTTTPIFACACCSATAMQYCSSFDAVFATEGVKVVLTPYRSPQANAHIERLIGGLRREVLDHVLILHRRHLVDVLGEYVAHHNSHRPHPHDVERPIPGKGAGAARAGAAAGDPGWANPRVYYARAA